MRGVRKKKGGRPFRLVLLLMAVAFVYLLVRLPDREVSAEEQQRQLSGAADAYWQAQEENNRLRRLLAESNSSDFVERVARRDYGYCWYGETIYEVANLPQSPENTFEVYGQN